MNAQTIFKTEYKNQADITVKVVEHTYQADLLVYKCQFKYEVKGNKGLWYITDTKYASDKTVFFVPYKYQADLEIYYVEHKYEARWVKESKKYLLEQNK
jgi:hypothetical protein